MCREGFDWYPRECFDMYPSLCIVCKRICVWIECFVYMYIEYSLLLCSHKCYSCYCVAYIWIFYFFAHAYVCIEGFVYICINFFLKNTHILNSFDGYVVNVLICIPFPRRWFDRICLWIKFCVCTYVLIILYCFVCVCVIFLLLCTHMYCVFVCTRINLYRLSCIHMYWFLFKEYTGIEMFFDECVVNILQIQMHTDIQICMPRAYIKQRTHTCTQSIKKVKKNTHVQSRVYIHKHSHTYIQHAQMQTHTHPHMHTQTCTCAYIHITYKLSNTHACTHIHT